MNSAKPRSIKSELYEHLARVGKALSSPSRLELLDVLAQAPRTVEDLAQEAGLSMANASQHLRVLRLARLVEAEKEGLFVRYRVADTMVSDFMRQLRALAEMQIAEINGLVRQFADGRAGLERLEKETLLKRAKRGEVIILDVRPQQEYAAGHIRGAHSVPLKDLQAHLGKLPRTKQIVAYCRGPYCVLAVEAVKLLTAKGFRAVRLEDGVPEWRAQGLPVTVGERRS